MAMARVPFNEGASPTPAYLQTIRGGVYALTPSIGAPAKTIQKSFASFDELGNPVYDRTLWETETTSTSGAIDADEPVIAVAVRSVNGQAAIVAINLRVTYHMEWFDLHSDDATVQVKDVSGPQKELSDSRRPREQQFDEEFSVCSRSDKLSSRRR